MAYTNFTQVFLRTSAKVAAAITGTGTTTPFSFIANSGNFWGQVTFQSVNTTISALVMDLQIDMTGVDANFVPLFTGLDFNAAQARVLNLDAGNIRYRFNVTSFTGTSADIWVIGG